MNNHWFSKGGLISESFSFWLKSPKKIPNHSPVQTRFGTNIWRFEPVVWKHSEIKPHLASLLEIEKSNVKKN